MGKGTFLAPFCTSGCPLAKTVGIFLKKLPPPWRPTTAPFLWEFQTVTSPKIFSMGMRTFLAGFALLEVLWQKAVGIFLEKQPLLGDRDPPLGISKSYLSKNLQHGDANISGGFCTLEVLWQKPLGFSLKHSPLLGDHDDPPRFGNFKNLPLQKSLAWGCQYFWRVFALLEVLWQKL